jgi:hypothetical protein
MPSAPFGKPTPRSSVVFKDFQGVINAAASEDIPPGATEVQVNVTCVKGGELATRQGYRVVTFED